MKHPQAAAGLQPVRPDPRPPAASLFDDLFLREYSRVVAIAHRVLGDRHGAEDVAQEVFLDFSRRHRANQPWAPAWLHAAAVHTALNRLRGERRRRRREAGWQSTATSVDPATEVEDAEQRAAIRAALARLPRRAAYLLALRYSGLRYAEVADALGIGVDQVGTRLRRAEQALRKEMTP